VLTPEHLKPPELFPNAPNAWDELPDQIVERGYHAVAGLLPDGRAFSGGGVDKDPGAGVDSRHTIEILSPPYMMLPPGPTVTLIDTDSPSVEWDRGFPVIDVKDPAATTFEVDITLGDPNDPSYEIKRVALLKPSTSTHAFDTGQRYVVLRTEDPDVLSPSSVRIEAQIPPEWALPPGFYFLTAVDKGNRPSPGRWVLVRNSNPS